MSHPPIKPNCEAIINIFPAPFVIIDRQFQIVSANQQYKDHYQVGSEEIIGKHCYEVSHKIGYPCSQNGEHCPLEEVTKTGKPITVMHIHCTHDHDEHVQISAAPIFDENGEVLYMGETIQPLPEQDEEGKILIGRSKPILRLISILYRVAPTQSTVFLLGESGVGKDCAARYIHQHSDRNNNPFVVVDCGALGENLIESELFGHEKGSFTGADKKKKGLFEAADNGTLFIDEIGELPLHLQTKLLRVLETGTIRRTGGIEYLKVNVRIIAATNRDPKKMLEANKFRQDLYYRLSAFPVQIPTLRERKEDIPELAEFFLKQIDEGENHIPLSPEVIEKLLSYDYYGNIRELKNIIERAIILSAGNNLLPEFIIFEETQDSNIVTPHYSKVTEKIRPNTVNSRITTKHVLEALKQCNGHRLDAANLLGVSERTIYRHIKNLQDNNSYETN
jgi:two-component system, NtrC family, response regulator AtoC